MKTQTRENPSDDDNNKVNPVDNEHSQLSYR